MKYLFVAVAGLVLGAAGALAVLYYNPLSQGSAASPNATDRVLHYSLPDQVLEFAVGEDARLFGQDTGNDSLWEETIDRTAVLGLVLNDGANQPAALASRLMATSADTDLLLRGVLLDDHWLVTIPERRHVVRSRRVECLAIPQRNARAGLVSRAAVERPDRLLADGGARAKRAASRSALPARFAAARVRAVEHYEISALDRQRDLALATRELHLNLPGPQVASQ